MLQIETENSTYLIDEVNNKYLRRAIREQAILSKRLEYETWLPLKNYEIHKEGCWVSAWSHLHIWHEESTLGIYTSEIKEISSYDG